MYLFISRGVNTKLSSKKINDSPVSKTFLEACSSDDSGELGSDEEIDHCSQRTEESDSKQDAI